jgi:deoxyribodipyrimidine photo-lyase
MLETLSRWMSKAALVVTDKPYLRVYKSWSYLASLRAECRMVEVEGDVVFPVQNIYPKEAYSAKQLRDAIYRTLPDFEMNLVTPGKADYVLSGPLKEELIKLSNSFGDSMLDNASLKRNVSDRVETFLNRPDSTFSRTQVFRGGYPEAINHLKIFLETRLDGFFENRNNPAVDWQSNLSPYMHAGQISIREIIQKIISSIGMSNSEFFSLVTSCKPGQHYDNRVNGALEFFEEAVVRRELAINFCFYNEDYDQYSSLPQWARESLREHMSDPRPYLYDLPALENAETHDPYWNAAQQEMLKTGKMHGYMRMYWGKKIIEWCREPEEAFQIALYLNNKYQHDGRDPNSYAGVAWCFGKHDRPWSAFPVFGSVRTMTSDGLKRKFDMKSYVSRIEQL